MINERNHVLQHGHNANKNEHEVAVFVVSTRHAKNLGNNLSREIKQETSITVSMPET